MIRIEHLTYTYPAARSPALQDIDLTLDEGAFCAVIGANGAGKSTLCLAVSGFVPNFYQGNLQGEVRIGERVVSTTPLADLAGEIGLVFANPFNQITGARFTVGEEIAFGLENLGIPPAE